MHRAVPAGAAALGADFDPFTPDVIRDPQHYDGLIREAAPVVYFPKYDIWATGRHAQTEQMMRDWRTFSSTEPAFGEPGQRNILLNEDPPEQQRARSVISKGLSNSVLRRMRDSFEQEADRLVRRLLDGPEAIDGHADLAKAYVLKVFPDALGLGDQNREMLVRFGHAQFNAFGPRNEIYHESMAAAAEVFEWVAVNCRRDAVQPGGISMMMYEAADAGAITREEAEMLVRTLYSAGSDTTIFAIGNTLRARGLPRPVPAAPLEPGGVRHPRLRGRHQVRQPGPVHPPPHHDRRGRGRRAAAGKRQDPLDAHARRA